MSQVRGATTSILEGAGCAGLAWRAAMLVPSLALLLATSGCPGSVDLGRTWDGAEPLGNFDAAVPPDLPVKPLQDAGTPGATNSGAICSTAKPCKAKDESCLMLQQAASAGMCLGRCSSAGAPCPAADPKTQRAVCAFQAQSKQYHCAYLCAAQGKTYKCPDDTSYSCVALDPQQPTLKLCVPK